MYSVYYLDYLGLLLPAECIFRGDVVDTVIDYLTNIFLEAGPEKQFNLFCETCLSLFCCILVITLILWRSYSRLTCLSKSGVETAGRITAYAQHTYYATTATIKYAFNDCGDVLFQGQQNLILGWLDPQRNLYVGLPIVVTYMLVDPRLNRAKEFLQKDLKDAQYCIYLIFYVWVLLCIATFLVGYSLYHRHLFKNLFFV